MAGKLEQRLAELIRSRTGLRVQERDGSRLQALIERRAVELSVPGAAAFFELLEGADAQAQREWAWLVPHLTTGESYFLRDKGHVALLRDQLLPELIQRQRAARTLRLWSAGCSTGEEPYSLAILLHEILPDPARWRISIGASDLNLAAIEKARRGIYSEWSFRSVEPETRDRYFRRTSAGWSVNEAVRARVQFYHGNFLDRGSIADMVEFHNLDLIVCRNVFIYFHPDAVRVALKHFEHALRPGGFLLLGHAEGFGSEPPGLSARPHPDAMVYQKVEKTGVSRAAVESKAVAATPDTGGRATSGRAPAKQAVWESASRATEELLEKLSKAQAFLRSGECERAVELAAQVVEREPANRDALLILAQGCANLGRYPEAESWSRQSLARDPMSVAPHLLLAQLAEHQGDLEEARRLYRKIIYLAPSHAGSYLELAALYDRQNDPQRALKTRRTALHLLQLMPPDSAIEPYVQMTARELVRHTEDLIRQTGGTAKPRSN
jgi:chemotaxis protein methyltransferase CheR